ncbi:hypothetical protein BKA64DRAFT_686638 [Cadophora sp. MPI-SDFR-AT-0126]|nr:hypothetical protein BKA64DRAFT_686638 [Leotiomycetes sp. MPI-SDFR-AT-0126]
MDHSVHQKGYPSVAAHLASSSELATFRKFSNLNMRNLLYMQTELIMLEAELKELDQQDASDKATSAVLQSWEAVLRGTSERDATRKEVALSMRRKLQEYNEALAVQSQILSLESPSERVLAVHKEWLDKHGHPVHRPIIDRGDEFLDQPYDLVALAGAERSRDPLTSFLINHCGELFKVQNVQPSTPAALSNIYYYSEQSASRLSNFISLMLATLLLVGGIVSLYFVKDEGRRLGMIGGYTVLFATGLFFCTAGKKGEIFGATAAYAAVLVVYISGSSS